MASATFTLRAVDQTRAAFASAQNSLQRVANSARDISRNMTSLFGFRAAIQGIRQLNSAMEQAEKSGTKIGLTKEEVDSLTVATNLYDKAVQNIQITVGKAAEMVARMFGSTTNAQEATNIRLAQAKPELDDIHEKLQRQILDNELIGETDDRHYAALLEQISALENKAKMQDDAVKKATAELQVVEAIGVKKSMEQKFYQDQNDTIEQRIALERQLKQAVGIEPDNLARINKLLQDRANIAEAIRNIEINGIQDEMMRNDLRKDQNKITAELTPLLQDHYQLERQIGDAMANSFQTAIFEGGKFKDVLKDITRQIIEMIFYQTITRRLAGFITGALIQNPLVGTFARGAYEVPPGFADGGDVMGGKAIIVGERGPELFVPKSSGSIIPNHKTGSALSGGGTSVTVNYNIASGVSRSELAPILESERRRLKAEIPDMVRRGGAYRAAFA